MVFKLVLTALYNAILSTLIYIADKKKPFNGLSYKVKQLIIGVLLGAMAIFASTNLGGVDVGGNTVMNVRDAAPICGGLIFGAPAGIIAGIIGGLYRYISAVYGITGTYTRLACSVSTVLAGFIAAALRKFMFDDKKPGWVYGLGIGVICEVIHMLMIFFTNANDPITAFNLVKVCSLPMMLCNGFSVGAAVLAVSLLGRSGSIKQNRGKHISRMFQVRLFVCIVIAYALTSTYTYVLQSRMSNIETESVIRTNIDDVDKDILDMSDSNLLDKAKLIRSQYMRSYDKSTEFLQLLSKEHNVAEIHIIDTNGIIVNTNIPEYIGFDMASGEQSGEFLVLLDGTADSYVQKYRPQSYDSMVDRKYGGITLPEGGFIQIGYDADEFMNDIDSTVKKIAKNRHIGEDGFIAVCDDKWNIISEETQYYGKNLKDLGTLMDTDKNKEKTVFNIELNGIQYLCEYEFEEGYYIAGFIPKSEALFMRDVSVYLSSFMEMLIFSALFALVYFLIKRLVIDNLNKVNLSLSKITSGNLEVTVDVRSNEEFASLSDDINSTVDTLKRYISEAEARIDAELEFAKQIQYSALPSVFPPYPNRRDFDIYACMYTAKEVGGDFYDFYMLDESTVAFLIADVSGKGIPAAMFMMKAKTIIKDLAESGLEVNEIFTRANTKLCENNDAGMFVTAWMAIVDLKTGVMSVANAGHNPPVFKRAGGSFAYEKQRAGFVLAGMEGIKYKKTEMPLAPGDRIYLYTDGVTEATDSSKQLYGEERLLNILNSLDKTEVKPLCEAVKCDIDKFVGDAPQFDDITMVSFTLNFIKGDDKLLFMPNSDAGAAVSEFAQQLTSKLDVLPKISGKVNIAIDEIASNIINYSNAKTAAISYTIENGRLYLVFEDDGRPYDPLEAEEPDITLSAEERQLGGLGIFMVKKMAESMDYKYESNKNILKLVIALDS